MYEFGMRYVERDKWKVASGTVIMMIILIKNILSMYEFDMRHVEGGKRQVNCDVILI